MSTEQTLEDIDYEPAEPSEEELEEYYAGLEMDAAEAYEFEERLKADYGGKYAADRLQEILVKARDLNSKIHEIEWQWAQKTDDRESNPDWQKHFAIEYRKNRERLIQLSQRLNNRQQSLKELEAAVDQAEADFDRAYQEWLNEKDPTEDLSGTEHELQARFFEESNYASDTINMQLAELAEGYKEINQFKDQIERYESEIVKIEREFGVQQSTKFNEDMEARKALAKELKDELNRFNYGAIDLANHPDINENQKRISKMLRGELPISEEFAKGLKSISPLLFEMVKMAVSGDHWLEKAYGVVAQLDDDDDAFWKYVREIAPEGQCPECNSSNIKVVATGTGKVKGLAAKISERDRVRRCLDCDHEWQTVEVNAALANGIYSRAELATEMHDEMQRIYVDARKRLLAGGEPAEAVGSILAKLATENCPMDESLAVVAPKIAACWDEENLLEPTQVWAHSEAVLYRFKCDKGHSIPMFPSFAMKSAKAETGEYDCVQCAMGDALTRAYKNDPEKTKKLAADMKEATKRRKLEAGNSSHLQIPTGPAENPKTVEDKGNRSRLEEKLEYFKELHDKGLITDQSLQKRQDELFEKGA